MSPPKPATETVAIESIAKGCCPFCVGTWTLARSAQGPMLLHTMEPCAQFIALSWENYLAMARGAR